MCSWSLGLVKSTKQSRDMEHNNELEDAEAEVGRMYRSTTTAKDGSEETKAWKEKTDRGGTDFLTCDHLGCQSWLSLVFSFLFGGGALSGMFRRSTSLAIPHCKNFAAIPSRSLGSLGTRIAA